jgi:aerobic-type carbon monoxide dehydrogenase small subunit (CoxS/CutS family)
MTEMQISLRVNGKLRTTTAEPRLTLATILRRNLQLTGTHVGCEHGVCGACTVIVDGAAVRSCLMFGVQADGCSVTTIEGLASEGDKLSPLQQAFRKHHALQCGFCTPGILTTMHAFLTEADNVTEASVREVLSGNICRCTGYIPIVSAVMEVAASYRDQTP